jgi:hypothetical protein
MVRFDHMIDVMVGAKFGPAVLTRPSAQLLSFVPFI